MRIVGISNKTRYWQQYVFSNPPEGYRYSRMVDIPWHMLKVEQQFLAHTKLFFPFKHADIYHTYNGIVANRKPWVIEVESYLPRYKPMPEGHPLWKWGMKRLASDDCKWILFSSQHASQMNRDKLMAQGVDPAKMMVLYRAVEHFLPAERPTDVFQLLFVGNGFYRKGGMELLKAMQRIKRPELRLTIVSSMEIDWVVTPTEEQMAEVKRIIAEDTRITWVPDLPHGEVAQRMRHAHVFVNTTFGDTFNNAVREAMGCRLPVIASEVSALPEMLEHGVNGWQVKVLGRESDTIAEELAQRIAQLMDDPALLERFAENAFHTARSKFDLRVRNARLKELYDQALA